MSDFGGLQAVVDLLQLERKLEDNYGRLNAVVTGVDLLLVASCQVLRIHFNCCHWLVNVLK